VTVIPTLVIQKQTGPRVALGKFGSARAHSPAEMAVMKL
jgi:hypothetical protein